LSLLAIRNRDDAEQVALYTSLKDYVTAQAKLLSGSSSTVSSPSVSSMSVANVDLVKVRNVWLALHNTERATKKLTSFTYSSALE
jgi:hypothetical protein